MQCTNERGAKLFFTNERGAKFFFSQTREGLSYTVLEGGRSRNGESVHKWRNGGRKRGRSRKKFGGIGPETEKVFTKGEKEKEKKGEGEGEGEFT